MNAKNDNESSKHHSLFSEKFDEHNRRKQDENFEERHDSLGDTGERSNDNSNGDQHDPLKHKWNSLKNYQTNFVFLVGNSGAGKSTFITSLLSHLQSVGLQPNLFSKEVLNDTYNTSGINYFSEKCILYNRYQIFPERTDLRRFEYCSYKIRVDVENESSAKCFLPTTFIELSGELIRSLHPSYDKEVANDLRDEMTNFLIDIAGRSNISVQVLFLSDVNQLEIDWPIHDIFLSLFSQNQSIMRNLDKFLFHYVMTKWDQVSSRLTVTDAVEDVISREFGEIYNQMMIKTPGNSPGFYPFSVTKNEIVDLTDDHVEFINQDLSNSGFSFDISNKHLYNSITTDFSSENREKFSTLYINAIGESLLQNILDSPHSVIEIHEEERKPQQRPVKRRFGRRISSFLNSAGRIFGIDE